MEGDPIEEVAALAARIVVAAPAAPKVVAKGVDHMAMRIREVAKEHGVPLYEDPPLARQLYKDVDIEEEIPVDLYETVAQVIAFVFGQNEKKKIS